MSDSFEFKYRGKDFQLFGVSAGDYIFRKIAQTGCFYELDLLTYIESVFPAGVELGIDCGANLGNHSVFFGSFICRDLIAVEVNPLVVPVLRKNLTSNIEHFSLYEIAVGREAGRGSLEEPEDVMSELGMVSVSAGSQGDIAITTLDSLYLDWSGKPESGTAKVSFIKMDIEGMELDALKGATQLLKEHSPDLFIEAADREAYGKLRYYLSRFDYSPVNSHAITPVYHFQFRPSMWAKLRHAVLDRIGFYWLRSRVSESLRRK